MKYAILMSVLLATVTYNGCKSTPLQATNKSTVGNGYTLEYTTIVIEGCEYLVVDTPKFFLITHKGNCTNKIHHITNVIVTGVENK